MTNKQLNNFWKKVNKNAPNNCWEWTASLDSKFYGQFRLNGKNILAHRLSWIILVGLIPDNLCVLHKCDNTKCINPDHLWLGTQQDNIKDMFKKGRAKSRIGESNPACKLTTKQVLCIKALLKNGDKLSNVAKLYNINRCTVADIKYGRSWTSV